MKHFPVFVFVLLSLFAFGSHAATRQTLYLKQGWNLVTITKPLAESSGSVDTFLRLQPYEYDNVRKQYVRCLGKGDVIPGRAYWIFSRYGQSVELEQAAAPVSLTLPELARGWNLLGYIENTEWPKDVSKILAWQNGHFQ